MQFNILPGSFHNVDHRDSRHFSRLSTLVVVAPPKVYHWVSRTDCSSSQRPSGEPLALLPGFSYVTNVELVLLRKLELQQITKSVLIIMFPLSLVLRCTARPILT
jgi:hypothetical protein